MKILKLVLFILILVACAFFTGFNLDNKTDIWFFFVTFKNVPVFMNSLISFAFGILCALPVVLFGRSGKSSKNGINENKVKKSNKTQDSAQVKYIGSSGKKSKESREGIIAKIRDLNNKNDSSAKDES